MPAKNETLAGGGAARRLSYILSIFPYLYLNAGILRMQLCLRTE
ncbi:hypothetical protein SLEP1_g41528 [Rubroshorea leprosula]|uniref:Uncharacterized protein n=1 Tax=Rubroshorea leprosula TaxID=152421 RepID=A0AAV5L6U1_9ROSI|nr:hypothetical protein SLEP1_g41528 [Rubroshorea leprosula]